MSIECKHHYWAPMDTLRLCYKCGDSVNLKYADNHSWEELRQIKIYHRKEIDPSLWASYKKSNN